MKTNILFLSLAQFFLEWEMFQTIVLEKKHVLHSVTFFLKLCCLLDNVEKYFWAGEATDDKVTRAHCMLDTKGYKDTHRICNTSCISTARVVTRTRSVFVIRTLPVFLEVAVVYPSSPLTTPFPSRDGQNWIQCYSVRGREHSFLISDPTEKRIANNRAMGDTWLTEAGVTNVDVGPYHQFR
jgi:hypothetical protein